MNEDKPYTPPPPALRPNVVTLHAPEGKKVPVPSDKTFKEDNEDHDPNEQLTPSFLHPFANSFSGTGYGRAYWGTPTNPFDN